MGARTGLIGEHLPNTNLLTHPEPIGQPKPFMGKGIGRQPHPLPPHPANTEAQSTPAPRTNACATAPTTAKGSGRSLRNVGTATTDACANDSSINDVKPPAGPTSTNRVAPAECAKATLSAKRTASRMWRTQ
ncbi:hypothetical protein MMRN_07010 [Mycobacterium marinum]|nr:hypothetical protein MMRN_06990 [Mycobacterium marinum]BBC63805.1 hypothetical protein MMRN_07010 [Mycobacterium marinum]